MPAAHRTGLPGSEDCRLEVAQDPPLGPHPCGPPLAGAGDGQLSPRRGVETTPPKLGVKGAPKKDFSIGLLGPGHAPDLGAGQAESAGQLGPRDIQPRAGGNGKYPLAE